MMGGMGVMPVLMIVFLMVLVLVVKKTLSRSLTGAYGQVEKRKNDEEKPKRRLMVGDDGELVEISEDEEDEDDYIIPIMQ